MYKTLTHLQISILTMRSYKTSFVFISRLYLYCPVIVEGIRTKIAMVFWPDNSIYNFLNVVHGILKLDSLVVEWDIVMHYL